MPVIDSEHPSQHILKIQARQPAWPIPLPQFPPAKEADDETLIHLVTEALKRRAKKRLK
jgi:hypothetical protein